MNRSLFFIQCDHNDGALGGVHAQEAGGGLNRAAWRSPRSLTVSPNVPICFQHCCWGRARTPHIDVRECAYECRPWHGHTYVTPACELFRELAAGAFLMASISSHCYSMDWARRGSSAETIWWACTASEVVRGRVGQTSRCKSYWSSRGRPCGSSLTLAADPSSLPGSTDLPLPCHLGLCSALGFIYFQLLFFLATPITTPFH